jgi:maltose/moltooligosaccharide transporter
MQKPRLSSGQIFNMSMGFFGIQMGFALQNANASRILQTFGADVEHLSWFWIVAPLTGMIIQPIIGHYSDRTWTKLGRRRPYFLAGALLTACALALMPNAAMFSAFLPAVLIGAGMLMFMDASINVAMEPFRALVADMLPKEQSTTGFSVQTFLIGIGAVIGSWLPYVLLNGFGIGENVTAGGIPMNVVISFFTGAIVLIVSILWTVVSTKEYSPQQMAAFHESAAPAEESSGSLMEIFRSFRQMPKTMRQLAWVQFFSWIGLFGMWVYTTPAVAQHFYHTSDPTSAFYQEAGDWVGILFGVYNAVAMVVALMLIPIARNIGRRRTHAVNLAIGAIGLISILFIESPRWLILPMIGVGIAWASILAMPYAILAPSLPAGKTGIYMGIFLTLTMGVPAFFKPLRIA